MENTFSLVTINGSPNQESKTGTLIDLAAQAIAERVDVTITNVRPYDLGPGFTGATSREEIGADVEQVLQTIEQADMLIADSPVFRGSYTGLFKHLFDLVDQYALEDMPVLLIATGGGERHSLVIDHQLRPLFAFFQAHTLPLGIYASRGDFIGTELYNPPIFARIERAADIAADLIPASRHLRQRPVVEMRVA
jgi:FMN reductase